MPQTELPEQPVQPPVDFLMPVAEDFLAVQAMLLKMCHTVFF